jgi:hypothetical protein
VRQARLALLVDEGAEDRHENYSRDHEAERVEEVDGLGNRPHLTEMFPSTHAYQQTDLPQAVEQLDQDECQVAGVGQQDQVGQDLVQLAHHVVHVVVVLADLAPELVLTLLKPGTSISEGSSSGLTRTGAG